MKINKLVLGAGQTNCYLIINEQTNELLIVDPGAEAKTICSHIDDGDFKPCAILLTHSHGDHIGAVNELRDTYHIPVYMHEEEREVAENPDYNLSSMFGGAVCLKADKYVGDGDGYCPGGMNIRIIHTPGHTPGGCCYYFAEEKVLFSGDTLFHRSIGRSDFPTGNTLSLLQSVKGKLFVLDEDVKVYPGHMGETTIGIERRENPFIH